jgi:hypothetical protein
MDHHASYLRGFLGLTDVEVVSAWGAVPEVLEPTTTAARARLAEPAGQRVDVAA